VANSSSDRSVKSHQDSESGVAWSNSDIAASDRCLNGAERGRAHAARAERGDDLIWPKAMSVLTGQKEIFFF
jgi:hypothetical protein